MFKKFYNFIFNEIKFRLEKRKIRKRLKELRKKDPFIYK